MSRAGALVATVLAAAASAVGDEPLFEDVAAETGLRFQHTAGATGSFHMPEIMGSGVALFDYDSDGDLDVYLLQGAMLDKPISAPKQPFGNRLFRNELEPSGEIRYVDVTEQAGVGHKGFSMGVAVGDYDNDGAPDLFLTTYGPNVLYRNRGDGTFQDVTADAGLAVETSFHSSAAFADYDADGDLDLFTARYNAFTVQGAKDCYSHAGGRDYCGPKEYAPLPDRLYRNDGEWGFVDVTKAAGVDKAFGNGLGVVWADFDGDARIDIYVANDKTPNQLWMNQGEGRFLDQALLAGAAYNGDGMPEAGMGAAAADYDGDGDEDLFVTHLGGETNTLYQNDGSGLFEDVTSASGLGHTSVPYTSFGTNWFDYDNDGLLDLFVANGEVRAIDSRRSEGFPYGQRNQLFRNDGARFQEVTERAGAVFGLVEVSRGAAFGDVDNDGDLDIMLSNANGPARLLINRIGGRNHWLKVRLVGTESNRDGYGARVALLRASRRPIWRRAAADGSYLSASDPSVHFGLGGDAGLEDSPLESLAVLWQSGTVEQWPLDAPDQIIVLVEGEGASVGAERLRRME